MARRLKEKSIPLSLFFIKYFIYIFILIIVICLSMLILFYILVNIGIIYPANYTEQQINELQHKIQNTEIVNENLIPKFCNYIIFDFNGNVINGNIKNKNISNAWEAITKQKINFYNNFYKVIKRKNEYCVIEYRIQAKYKSEILQKYLYPPEVLNIILTIFIIFIAILLIAFRFSYVLKKKMYSLISITEKIQNQDLNFNIEKSNIKEINIILQSMDKMKNELKYSLESKWKSEEIQKEQISALAHDLKTPLTIINGNNELLYDTNPNKKQLECINYINESCLKMQNYIKMLIQITKANNLYNIKLEKILVSNFVDKFKTQAKSLCIIKNFNLEFKYKNINKYFEIDINLLERALNNILYNAIEHSNKNKKINIFIYEENSYIVFSIIDNGNGFTKEALKYAKEKFYMSDKSRTSSNNFGMGLYITNEIVKQHNGELIIENLKQNKGAKVIIKIPIL